MWVGQLGPMGYAGKQLTRLRKIIGFSFSNIEDIAPADVTNAPKHILALLKKTT